MHYVKLSTGYYRDVAVATLEDVHEVMFTRGLAYCGDADSKGHIPDPILPSLMRNPSGPRCRRAAQALVRANLWLRVDGGYQIRSWEHWQEQLDALAERRRKDRERKAAERARVRGTVTGHVHGQSEQVSHVESEHVTGGELEREGDAAAAADEVRGHATELPPPLLDLKARLNDAALVVRWDKLTEVQVAEIVALLETHGPARLVKSAQSQWQKDNPPSWAQAWIAGWAQIPTAVSRRREKCPEHGLEMPCGSCAADAKAAS